MNIKNITTLIVCAMCLSGCNQQDQKTLELQATQKNQEKLKVNQLPHKRFSANYAFSDFNLSSDYIYWEVRRGRMESENNPIDEVISQYDKDVYASLSDSLKKQLKSVTSKNGYSIGCMPDYCPIYAVALKSDHSIRPIVSAQELLEFFGYIDTEAELAIWLNTSPDESGVAYKKTKEGYQVIISWDDFCGTRGERLATVTPDGHVERLQALSKETYPYCI